MVRVRKHLANNFPCLAKVHMLFVHKDSLKLGHRDGRMSVIQLDSHEVGQGGVGKIELLEPSENVLQRRRAPEVLLLQSKFFALVVVVVRVEDSSDGLGG
jgi:hypothetical protein